MIDVTRIFAELPLEQRYELYKFLNNAVLSNTLNGIIESCKQKLAELPVPNGTAESNAIYVAACMDLRRCREIMQALLKLRETTEQELLRTSADNL